MIVRIGLAIVVLAMVAVALWHPAPVPTLGTSPSPVAAAVSPVPAFQSDRRKPRADEAALVYVVGAVVHPGLYRLGIVARAVDAVNAAGGLTRRADRVAVNLAAYVRDGDELVVPAIGESSMPPRARTHRARRRHLPDLPATAVDVNAAGADDLAAVPGIGRAVAQRIVEMRERIGPFGSLDQLLDVAGMTDQRLERARPYLTMR
ncbi:MAG: ComEA family DNA-binding protein [Candidatus Eremiobacteraeota bacterium]|nr:ComEA family DNA-binding protein [Candidatus Eremiobacteraeota bacterium]MBV8374258.1 ComEA family DNA-binding protein [Candidatus Eremiobacteraeota bacterium]